MAIREQSDVFQTWVNTRAGPSPRPSKAYGASNLPIVLENGFRLGLFNLNKTKFGSTDDPISAFYFVSRLQVPPQVSALHIAFVYTDAEKLEALRVRRDRLIEETGNAKQVRVYIHEGAVYLRKVKSDDKPEGFADAWSEPMLLEPHLPDRRFGSPIRPDAVYFGDVEHPGRLPPTSREYVNYLAAQLAPQKVVRLRAGEESGGAAIVPSAADFAGLCQSISALGGVYSASVVARYHAALTHLEAKHFALLTGISGTGKTLLAKAYAYAILGEAALDQTSDGYFNVPVQPGWSDPADLLGYMDAISGRYRRTAFLDAVLRANSDSHRPVFVCLDEMNLAQPEHYFSDFLSAMETRGEIRLHDDAAEEDRDGGVPRVLPWPSNLYITGTVNVDETTRPFSPRLLDRANAIDLGQELDVDGFVGRVRANGGAAGEALDEVLVDLLKALIARLQPYGLHFGYRVIEELAEYVGFCQRRGLLDGEVIDRQVDQKILVKLRGGPDLAPLLAELKLLLVGREACLATLDRMQQDLDLYDSFEYWR